MRKPQNEKTRAGQAGQKTIRDVAPESNKPPLSVRLKAVLALAKETGKQ
jgi:hypothetical protein